MALRSGFPVLKSQGETLNLAASLEFIHQDLFAPSFRTDINRDVYGALRLGANWRASSLLGLGFAFNTQLSQGLGGRDAADAAASKIPLSRQGAGPDFSKLSGDVRLSRKLPADFQIDLISRAQASWAKPVFLPEAFALDGADGLSAFPGGALNVDSGATFRAELPHPFAILANPTPMTLSPYLFAAQGWGWTYQPTAAEQPETIASARGLGAHLAMDPAWGASGASLGAELGRQHSNLAGRRDATRFGLNAAIQF
jgi:hemolysin activation/secretion protein